MLCSGCEVGLVGVGGRDAIWWGGWVVSCWCAALGVWVSCCLLWVPLSSGPLLRCDPCVGGSSGAGGGLDLMPVGRGGCWW